MAWGREIVGLRETAMNDKRCRSSDGKQGRCSCPAMDGNVYCAIHYVLAKVRGRNNMRFESNDDGRVLKKFKANSDGGSLKKLKLNDDGGELKINHHMLGARLCSLYFLMHNCVVFTIVFELMCGRGK